MKDMTSCFIDVVKTLDEVRLFGDGFDECSEWNALWTFLSKLWKSQCHSLRFLFTSRPERDIRDAVNSLGIASLDLTRSETARDIERYVIEELKENPRFTRVPFEGRKLISETLIIRAQGM
jgi:hypothetical protein